MPIWPSSGFAPGSGVRSAAYQAVCSPYRNPLDEHERTVIRAGLLASLHGARPVPWPAPPGRRTRACAGACADGPFFDNQVATLRLDGRRAEMKLDKTVPGEGEERRLECVFERRLA